MNKRVKNHKDGSGIVYSTNPEFFSDPEDYYIKIPPSEQKLNIFLSNKHRKGKVVTLINGFIGDQDELKTLEKELKSLCATGGSLKNKEILIQGDFRQKISHHLKSKGFHIKLS